MCDMPQCGRQARAYKIQTTVVGARQVELHICPECDTSKCRCGAHLIDPHAAKCPIGHPL